MFQYNGSVTFYSPIEQGIEVDVFVFSKDGNKIEQWEFDGGKVMYSVLSIDAVGVVPRLNGCFVGIQNIDLNTFSSKGNSSGNVIIL